MKEWKYLETEPDTWRKQLVFKGRRLRASTVWLNMLTNSLTIEEVADNHELTVEQVKEAIEYCKQNIDMIEKELQVDRQACGVYD